MQGEINPLEDAVMALYAEFTRMRRANREEELYAAMGMLITTLQMSREVLRKHLEAGT